MQIRQANMDDLATVTGITHSTIREIYPHYYPAGAVRYFLAHHHTDNVRKDIAANDVFLCISDSEEVVGTVTVKGNEITRLFVLPEHQRNGYGRAMMDFAEQRIAKSFDVAELSASFPAKDIYRRRGYQSTDYNTIHTREGDYLCYDTMQKRLLRTCEAEIRYLTDADEKANVSRMILEALTEWFSLAEGRERYIAESCEQPFFAAFEDGKPVGFLCLKQTGDVTAEIAVMGVRKDRQRQGIGKAMFDAARLYAVTSGYLYMQVKTVKMGTYPAYDATNSFYRSVGFRELETMPQLWGAADPCQIYVKYLG